MRKYLFALCLLTISFVSFAQDTTIKELNISGNIGVTNNGISIIPTFSLAQPAFNISYALSRGGRFSIDPDLRLTFDGTKGGGMLWFRYKLKSQGKFKINIGAHPAFNFALRSVTKNGKTWDITQSRRFLAAEFAPSYTVSKHLTIGMYYLRGRGLQDDGPTNMHFITFNTAISGIPLSNGFNLGITPQVYYLKVDKEDGFYFTANALLTKAKSSFAFMSTMNKEIRTNIAGSKNFDWNFTLLYMFNKKYRSIR